MTYKPKMCTLCHERPAVIEFDFDDPSEGPTSCDRCGSPCGGDCCGAYWWEFGDLANNVWALAVGS